MTHHYTVLHGGTILTFDGARPTDAASRGSGDSDVPDAAGRRATAICFAHDRILAVGGDAEILALAGPDSQVVDLRGRAVLPGFVEPHAHPYWEGMVAGMRLLAGRERRPILEESLRVTGWRVEVVETYAARAVRAWPEDLRAALDAGEIDGVLHYSPRSAALALALIGREPARRLQHFCISSAVAAVCRDWAPDAGVFAASHPDEEGLITLLRAEDPRPG